MERSSCELFTVNITSVPFVNEGIFDTRREKLYWNAISAHEVLREAGYTVKLFRRFQYVCDIGNAFKCDESDYVKKPIRSETSNLINAYLVRTEPLIAWIASQPSINRSPIKPLCRGWMESCCEKALLAHIRLSTRPADLRIGTIYITIRPSGEIRGWDNLLGACCAAVRHAWDDRANRTLGLAGMVEFAIIHTVSPTADGLSRSLLQEFVVAAVKDFISPQFDNWVVNIYAVDNRIYRCVPLIWLPYNSFEPVSFLRTVWLKCFVVVSQI